MNATTPSIRALANVKPTIKVGGHIILSPKQVQEGGGMYLAPTPVDSRSGRLTGWGVAGTAIGLASAAGLTVILPAIVTCPPLGVALSVGGIVGGLVGLTNASRVFGVGKGVQPQQPSQTSESGPATSEMQTETPNGVTDAKTPRLATSEVPANDSAAIKAASDKAKEESEKPSMPQAPEYVESEPTLGPPSLFGRFWRGTGIGALFGLASGALTILALPDMEPITTMLTATLANVAIGGAVAAAIRGNGQDEAPAETAEENVAPDNSPKFSLEDLKQPTVRGQIGYGIASGLTWGLASGAAATLFSPFVLGPVIIPIAAATGFGIGLITGTAIYEGTQETEPYAGKTKQTMPSTKAAEGDIFDVHTMNKWESIVTLCMQLEYDPRKRNALSELQNEMKNIGSGKNDAQRVTQRIKTYATAGVLPSRREPLFFGEWKPWKVNDRDVRRFFNAEKNAATQRESQAQLHSRTAASPFGSFNFGGSGLGWAALALMFFMPYFMFPFFWGGAMGYAASTAYGMLPGVGFGF